MPTSTTNRPTKKIILAGLALASVLILSTGCAPEIVPGAGTGSGSGGGSSESGGSSNTDGSNSGDNSGGSNSDGSTDSTDSTGSSGNDSGGSKGGDSASDNSGSNKCFVGSWYINGDKTPENFIISTTPGAVSVTIDYIQSYVIFSVMPDGTVATEYDNWVKNITLKNSRLTVKRSGVDLGKYRVDSSGTMTVSDTTIGSVTTGTATGAPEPSMLSQSKITCSGEELQLNAGGATGYMFRTH